MMGILKEIKAALGSGKGASSNPKQQQDMLMKYAGSVFSHVTALVPPGSTSTGAAKKSALSVALLSIDLPEDLEQAPPALFEFSTNIGLTEFKIQISKYTLGALIPGRVFRVEGKALVELHDQVPLIDQGCKSGDLIRIEAQHDDIRGVVWSYQPGVTQLDLQPPGSKRGKSSKAAAPSTSTKPIAAAEAATTAKLATASASAPSASLSHDAKAKASAETASNKRDPQPETRVTRSRVAVTDEPSPAVKDKAPVTQLPSKATASKGKPSVSIAEVPPAALPAITRHQEGSVVPSPSKILGRVSTRSAGPPDPAVLRASTATAAASQAATAAATLAALAATALGSMPSPAQGRRGKKTAKRSAAAAGMSSGPEQEEEDVVITGDIPAPPRDVSDKRPRLWNKENTLALLRGIKKYYVPSSADWVKDAWVRIRIDHEDLPGTNMTLKDRFVTIRKAVEKGFNGVRDLSLDSPEVQVLAKEICDMLP